MSIQGDSLQVEVVGCTRLKDTEWFSRQDPYVCLDYAGTRFRTRTHTDGDKDPIFWDKFTFQLFEGCREIKIEVWNSNTLSRDKLIGRGRVLLQKVLSEGNDDSSWTIQSDSGRAAGTVNLRMKYSKSQYCHHPPYPTQTYRYHPYAPQTYNNPPYPPQMYNNPPAEGYYVQGAPPYYRPHPPY
ncbi:unnamed protein product [Spirodela intermedia]|uniref:C2 domain-containing protein n=1 Tax=Spirodela intermedia TaxID=51605 RepID=A0A7I8JKG4_SPIIN|nr:unnamed protein product [Spirodela intermedia]CAA6670550.1 unnamed protein product [Spirodela intermedia]